MEAMHLGNVTRISSEAYGWTHNSGYTVAIVLPSGVTQEDVAITRSNECKQTVLIITDKTGRADPKKFQSIFTKGGYQMISGKSKKKEVQTLKLSTADVNASSAKSTIEQLHGKNVRGVTSSCTIMSMKFSQNIKPQLVDLPTSAGHSLKGKCELAPIDGKGTRFLLFNVEWEDTGTDELNIASESEESFREEEDV